MSQFFSTYGLWAFLGLIFAIMVLFGVSACRIDYRRSLQETGKLAKDRKGGKL